MQRYESYKPSMIPWIGELPQHWGEKNGKWLHRFRKDLNSSKQCDNVLSLTLRGVVNNNPDDPEGLVPKDYGTYQIFEKDDLVFKLIDLENFRTSRVGLVHERGIMSSAYLRVQPGKEHNPRYFYYYYFTLYQQGIYNKLGAGVRSTLGPKDLLEIGAPVPSRDEQNLIVAFLDKKTAEIDAAIAKKERMIELLEEHMSIHISRAVTQGLNRDAQRTELAWLGEIPSHWKPMKLIWICSSIRDGTHNPPAEIESEYRLLSVRNIIAGEFVTREDDRTMSFPAFKALARSYTVERGDVVLALVGGTTGKSAVVDIDCQKISVQRSLGILRPMRSKILPEFLNLSLKATSLQRCIWDIATKYAAQPGIYLEDVGNLKIAVPGIPEQKLIVNYCNEIQNQTNATIMSVKKEINSLSELKLTLIFDGVSGKVKV